MLSAALLVVASLCAALPPSDPELAGLEPVQVYEGKLVVSFHVDALEQAGLVLVDVEQTDDAAFYPDLGLDGEPLLFRIDGEQSDLTVLRTREGTFQPYGVLGGTLTASGGFTLVDPATGAAVDFHGFQVTPHLVRNDGPGGEPDPDYFHLTSAGDPTGDFQLCYVKIFFAADGGYGPGEVSHAPERLRIKAFDLVVTEHLAEKLGRPELVGRHLGSGRIDADVEPFLGRWNHPAGQNIFTPTAGGADSDAPGGGEGGVLDVSLGILSSITQLGHEDPFPFGRAGLSMATTSCNLGDVDVPWLAPNTVLQEDHPGIGMSLYRLREYDLGGASFERFEQVGVSWVKHGFFALSNSQCIPCQNPSNGTFLGVGCSDTYGTSNNGNRMWLGPRDEWDPHRATWEATGSYFDGTPVDDIRDESGFGNGSVNHRLEAFDADLNNPDATYYYEAIYLVRNDQFIENNIGSRECTMAWNGFSWQFQTPTTGNPLVHGPALRERWGDVRTVKALEDDPDPTPGAPTDDGNVVLSVDVTDLGNGTWRYEYALFNWTLDRRVGSFSVPAFGPVSDFSFHDIDDDPSNDWVPTVSGKNVTWTFPGVFLPGHKVGGPLEWGTLYNFGFTAAVPPGTHDAALGIHDPGAGGDLLAVETLAPQGVGLSADVLAPQTGSEIELIVRGGGAGALVAGISVNGILVNPLVITPSAVPFVGGEARVPVTVPAEAAGLEIGFVAADFSTQVLQLSNLMTLAVQ